MRVLRSRSRSGGVVATASGGEDPALTGDLWSSKIGGVLLGVAGRVGESIGSVSGKTAIPSTGTSSRSNPFCIVSSGISPRTLSRGGGNSGVRGRSGGRLIVCDRGDFLFNGGFGSGSNGVLGRTGGEGILAVYGSPATEGVEGRLGSTDTFGGDVVRADTDLWMPLDIRSRLEPLFLLSPARDPGLDIAGDSVRLLDPQPLSLSRS